MASTSVTKIGGVVVVTQVIPQNESAIPLQTAAQLAPPPAAQSPPTSPAKKEDVTATFLRGGPQGLGVVQIFIGVLCILFSLLAAYSEILILNAPLCLAAAFVVSGSLSVAAGSRTSEGLLRAALVWNVISVLLGLVGVSYVCWLLADGSASERFCDTVWDGMEPTREERVQCINKMRLLDVSVYGPLGLILVALVLQVCVTVAVCVFLSRTIRRLSRYAPFTVEVDDDAASGLDHDAALLDGEEFSRSAPNSP